MEKVWLKSYPSGVPAEINPDAYASICDVFDEAAGRFAERDAYICMGKAISYRRLDELSAAFAAYLQGELKLPPGTRVALMMPNLLQYPVALFGTLRAGCVVVNTNPLYTARELEHQLRDSGAEAIVILENFAHILQKILPKTAVKHVVVTSIGEMLGTLKGAIVNLVIRRVKKMVPPWSLPESTSWTTAMAAGGRHELRPAPRTASDIAFLQYTGGTTGVAKGAILTHRNIIANLQQAHAWIAPWVSDGKELIVTALPLYHIFALTANCLTFMKLGATNLLITNPRDIPGFVKELGKYQFTVITGVNTLFNALLNNPDFAKLDFSRLKVTLGGGMAVQKAVADRWKATTKCTLAEAYGLTETAPAATINPLDIPEYNGSIGLPISSTLIAIRNEEGADLPIGENGEIAISGPQVTQGYWKRDEDTREAFWPDGFFRSGDIGVMDERGFIRIVDRKKDMILVSGFNVYPNEIEAVVAMHPGVMEVAAVGVPDERSGEAVKVFVVRKDPALTAEALIAHCRDSLTGYKVPHQVEFRDELPKTNVGKILRRALRE